MNRRDAFFTCFISVSLLVTGLGCSAVCSALESATAGSEPQPGEWSGSLSYPGAAGHDVTWTINFGVSDDRTQVTDTTLMRYLGEPSPSTRAIWMMSVQPADIEGDSFSVTFTEIDGYMTYTHVFEGRFESSREAVGTLTTGGESYEWTATPVEL